MFDQYWWQTILTLCQTHPVLTWNEFLLKAWIVLVTWNGILLKIQKWAFFKTVIPESYFTSKSVVIKGVVCLGKGLKMKKTTKKQTLYWNSGIPTMLENTINVIDGSKLLSKHQNVQALRGCPCHQKNPHDDYAMAS